MAGSRPIRIVLPRTQTVERVVEKVVEREVVALAEPQEERDTSGNVVPVWLGQTFTYDGSNNLESIRVLSGDNEWVKTYTYTAGNQTSDSGWVKQ